MAETLEIKVKVAGGQQAERDARAVAQNLEKVFGNMGSNLGIRGVAVGTVFGNAIYNGVTGALSKITGAIEGVVSKAFGFLSDSVGKASDLQEVGVAMEVMLGNADKARELLVSLAEFAATTPFQLDELHGLTRRLLAYGFAQEEVIPTLRDLGNIAAGVGKDKLPFLITALGQVRAKTILSGEELKQFTETGVPLIEELARVTGYSVGEITDQTKDLGISYELVALALANLSKDGGKFAGLMDRISKGTLGGALSNIQDKLSGLMRTIGGITEGGDLIEGGMLDVLTKQANNFLGVLENSNPKLQEFGTKLGQALGDLINTYLPKIIESLPQLADDAIKFVDSFIENLPNIKKGFDDIVGVAGDFLNTIKSAFDFIGKIGDGIEDINALMKLSNDADTKLTSMSDSEGGRFKSLALPEYARMMGTDADSVHQLINGAFTGGSEEAEKVRTKIEEITLGLADQKLTWADLANISTDRLQKMGAAAKSTTDLTNTLSFYINNLGSNANISASQVDRLSNAFYNAQAAGGYATSALNAARTVLQQSGMTPRFASGGIVPGNLTSGDKVVARVNSGEMILTKDQQSGLFGMLKKLSSGNTNNFNAPINFGSNGQMQDFNLFSDILKRV